MEVELLKKEKSGIKTISYKTLKVLSDSNFGKLNRNIDVDELLILYPNIENFNLELRIIMIHHHFRGELTEPHIRCWVKIKNIGYVGIQDIFYKQWDKLK